MFVEQSRFLKRNNFSLILLVTELAYNINQIGAQISRILKIADLNRIDNFSHLYFAASHQPKRKMIHPCMIHQRFIRNGAQVILELTQRLGNSYLNAILIAINKIPKAKVMCDKAFEILRQAFGIFIDKGGSQLISPRGIINFRGLNNDG